MSNQERHYNIEKLNKIFAIASIILLFGLIGLFMKDYDRSWKDYQKEFRQREVEKTRVKFDDARQALDSSEEYRQLVGTIAKAQQEYAAQCPQSADQETARADLRAENDLLQQKYKFSKAELDVVKYRLEEAKTHHADNLAEIEKEFFASNQKTEKLKIDLEKSDNLMAQEQKAITDCGQALKDLIRQRDQLSRQLDLYLRKLDKTDPIEMSFANQTADLLRDLPVIDLANPNFKIDQIVLKEIREDVNFASVPRVDRCVTCHMGIANPEYAKEEQPYKTHPNLELYIDKDSPHPMEEFGCTSCHNGRSRGTSFISSAHTPQNEEQKKEWEKKYGWKEMELWEQPMYPLQYTEAGCFKCHSNEYNLPEAPKLNMGLQVIERAGCYNCHTIDRYKDWPKSGPTLKHLASKFDEEWAFQWIQDPQAFRHNTWMPAFFNQSNNSDPASQARGLQETHAMVRYLFAKSEKFDTGKMPVAGDLEKGKELVASVGCMGCHNLQPQPNNQPSTNDSLRTEHGPNLIGLGSKTSVDWLYRWLKDPSQYHATTRMPNLRLTDQEAADIATYLASLKNDAFDQGTVPAVDEKIINEIVYEFISKRETRAVSQEKIAAMNPDEKLLYAGEKLIGQYGCYSCHDIAGFEKVKPVGTELTEEGSKSLHNFDFGFVHIDHSKDSWFAQKLKDPRIFDKDKIKKAHEKLLMPNYYLADEEVEAVITALLGFVNSATVKDKIKSRTPENLLIEEGQEIVQQLNCQSCHIIEGKGGSIQKSVQDWLVQHDNRAEADAKALVTSFSPPNLIGEGKKVQAQWLFEFLHRPTPIRPWLKVRMPTYTFNKGHLNALVKYFNALDKEEFPFAGHVDTTLTPEELIAAEKLFSKDNFGCAQCHIVGSTMPGGTPDNWAPDFSLAKTRLKPNWIIDWLKDPQALLPGTKMPTYFDAQNFDVSGPDDILEGNEHEQLRVLRNYLMMISDQPSINNEPAEKPQSAATTDANNSN